MPILVGKKLVHNINITLILMHNNVTYKCLGTTILYPESEYDYQSSHSGGP